MQRSTLESATQIGAEYESITRNSTIPSSTTAEADTTASNIPRAIGAAPPSDQRRGASAGRAGETGGEGMSVSAAVAFEK